MIFLLILKLKERGKFENCSHIITVWGHQILRHTYEKEISHLIQNIQSELITYMYRLDHYFKESRNDAERFR